MYLWPLVKCSYNFKINFSPIEKDEYIENICEYILSNHELKNTIQDLIIKNHDEFEFEPNKLDYDIVLNKGEDHLEFEYHPVSGNKTTCEAQGNEDLQLRSTISIVCTAEDKETSVTYTISVKDIKKGMSKFFVVLLIILFILVLIYLVLRLLGYKIYFNFEVIGAFFRGLGEKIRNIFS